MSNSHKIDHILWNNKLFVGKCSFEFFCFHLFWSYEGTLLTTSFSRWNFRRLGKSYGVKSGQIQNRTKFATNSQIVWKLIRVCNVKACWTAFPVLFFDPRFFLMSMNLEKNFKKIVLKGSIDMKQRLELFLTIENNLKVLWNRVCSSFHLSFCCPSVLPSFALCWHFLGIGSLVFSRFWQGARNPYEVVHDRTRFFGITFFGPHWKNVLLCSSRTPIIGKNIVSVVWTKMVSVNQIAGFLNQLYLHETLMK